MQEKLEDTEIHLSAERHQTPKLGKMIIERDRQIRELADEIAKLKRSAERAVAKEKQRAQMPLDVDLGNVSLNELLMRSTRSGMRSGAGNGLNCSLSSGLGGGGRRAAGLSEHSFWTGNGRVGPLSSHSSTSKKPCGTHESPGRHKKSTSIFDLAPRLTPMQDPFSTSIRDEEVLVKVKGGRKRIRQKTAQKEKTGLIGRLSSFLKTE